MGSEMFDEYATKDGRFPLSSLDDGWQIPKTIEVDYENRALIWRWSGYSKINPGANERLDMLQKFAELADIDPDSHEGMDKVLTFARRWGVIAACSGHQLPASHLCSDESLECKKCGNAVPACCWPAVGADGLSREPMKLWKQFGLKVKAVFQLAAILKEKESAKRREVPDDIWQELESWRSKGGFGDPGFPIVMRFEVALLVTMWLQEAGVRPVVRWEDALTFTLSAPVTGGVMAPLAVQSMLMISRQGGLAWCSVCGNPFLLVKGQPRQMGRRFHYCEKCRKAGFDKRHSKEEFRKRERQEPDRPKRKRLTPEEQKQILKLYADRELRKEQGASSSGSPSVEIGFHKKLAQMFGVSESAIYKIIQRARGKHEKK